MAIKTTRLKREIKKIIADDPIEVHRYVLVDAEGYGDAPSYAHAVSWPLSWSHSYQGRIDPLGREVWNVMGTPEGVTAKRSFMLLLPYMDSGYPTTNDVVELYNSDGDNLGSFRVNNTIAYSWKIECNVMLIAPGSGAYG